MKKVLLLVLLAAVFVGFVFSGDSFARSNNRGFNDEEIRIGSWGPQTGPAAPWGAVARGADLLMKLVNEEGGIHGRKLKYFIRDDQYNPAMTKAVVKELVQREGIFAFTGGVGISGSMAVVDYLKQNNIVFCSPATACNNLVFPLRRNVFGVYPLFEDEASILTKYIVEKMGGKKIAMLLQPDTGKFALMGAEKRLATYGLKLTEKISVEATEKDLASQMLKIKNSGADFVIMFVGPTQAVIAMKTSAKIGYNPQWVAYGALSDFPLMNKISGGLFEGVIAGTFGEPPDSNNPLMVKYREAAKRLAPDERWGLFYYAGIIFAEPLVEALKRVGRDLSTEKLIKTLESMKGFKGIGPTVTFSKKLHQGTDSIRIVKCLPGGKYELLQDEVTNELATWKK